MGDAPPDGELCPSTLDADDARNGLALHAGALGVIIESGVYRSAEYPDADLERRVAAYGALLARFLTDRPLRAASREAVAAARGEAVPSFVPTNVLWANVGPRISLLPVVSLADSRVLSISTANLMLDRIVKHSVATPRAYWVMPDRALPYRALLERHGIPFEVLSAARPAIAAACTLDRLETAYDQLYQRYGGRQIVTCGAAEERVMPAGSLRVPVVGFDGRRAVPVLEPRQLYGLYQVDEFRATVGADGELPILLE